MNKYFEIFTNSYSDYFNYLKGEVLQPSWHNYFYWLLGLSLLVWSLEIAFPWRKEQKIFRKDFFLDTFYLFFNFFLLSLIAYNALSNIGVELFKDFLMVFNIENLVAINLNKTPLIFQFVLMFVIADFIQWNIHRLLHKFPMLWEFHKVHHSVEEMGFAAHFRFHWMETIIYKTLQYIPLAMLGFGLTDFFIVHIVSVLIGHLNHSNLRLTYGPFKYIINNPVMHLWHHAYTIPNKNGVNFGISLSIWDYLFKTVYLPKESPQEKLGFDGMNKFPKTFLMQMIYPFKKSK